MVADGRLPGRATSRLFPRALPGDGLFQQRRALEHGVLVVVEGLHLRAGFAQGGLEPFFIVMEPDLDGEGGVGFDKTVGDGIPPGSLSVEVFFLMADAVNAQHLHGLTPGVPAARGGRIGRGGLSRFRGNVKGPCSGWTPFLAVHSSSTTVSVFATHPTSPPLSSICSHPSRRNKQLRLHAAVQGVSYRGGNRSRFPCAAAPHPRRRPRWADPAPIPPSPAPSHAPAAASASSARPASSIVRRRSIHQRVKAAIPAA